MFPPRTILAAIDFSEPSRGALTFAAMLARRCEAALHMVYAEEPLLVTAAEQQGLDFTAETRAELTQFLGTAPPAAACTPDCIVNVGDAVSVILHAAGRVHADLIVLGAHGMSGAGRLLFGSVTEGVLLQSPRSVLVVPDWWAAETAGSETLELGPLVVGVDFQEPSMLALSAAAALAARLQTTVEAMHVVADLPVPERWRPHAERVIAERLDIARRDLARIVAAVQAPVPIVPRVEQGLIVERLMEVAAPLGGRRPMLVLGRRSSRSAGVPGAIAYRLASMTRVPVLMHKEA